MASTPEGRVKDMVKKVLVTHHAYYHMPVINGMGAPSLDFVCCHEGRYFAIETKAPGKKLTPRQEGTVKNILAAGGQVFVIDGEGEQLDRLKAFLGRGGVC
jgi:hypothetical protein